MGFSRGNSKLGSDIFTWSIPAGSTCPGKSEPCKNCYAQQGFFKMTSVKTSHEKNLEKTKEAGFVDWATAELIRLKAKVCRIHVSGDFVNVNYTKKWKKIITKLPDVRFFLYSRSWRVATIKKVLIQMSSLTNLRSWWSVDYDTGEPTDKPDNVRLAYMQVSATDIPKFDVDLVFRVDELRSTIMKKINDAVVCPVENGVNSDFTCTRCGICWRDKGETFDLKQSPLNKNGPKKVALTLI